MAAAASAAAGLRHRRLHTPARVLVRNSIELKLALLSSTKPPQTPSLATNTCSMKLILVALAIGANALSLQKVSQQAVSRRALGGFGAAGLATFIGEAPALAAEKKEKAAKAPKPLKDVALVKELFDSKIPAAGVMAWYDAHLSPDVSIEFNGGAVKLGKKEYLGLTQAILDSVPNFSYTAPKGDFKKGKGNTVTWTAVVTGTHTGKPYSPLKGVPPAKPNKKAPAKLQNDPEAITVTLNEAGQMTKLSVAAIKGGKGFSGPVGFYLQMGGDPSKLPKA